MLLQEDEKLHPARRNDHLLRLHERNLRANPSALPHDNSFAFFPIYRSISICKQLSAVFRREQRNRAVVRQNSAVPQRQVKFELFR